MEVVLRSSCAIKPDTETSMNIEDTGTAKRFDTAKSDCFIVCVWMKKGLQQTMIIFFDISRNCLSGSLFSKIWCPFEKNYH
jgi:hypothetical protein